VAKVNSSTFIPPITNNVRPADKEFPQRLNVVYFANKMQQNFSSHREQTIFLIIIIIIKFSFIGTRNIPSVTNAEEFTKAMGYNMS